MFSGIWKSEHSRKSLEIYSCEMYFTETRKEIRLKEMALQKSVQKNVLKRDGTESIR
jgi:hypothetical protein